jgi:threonyl-tRNA synthetase
MRVRGFTQDDAHIFCTEQQILMKLLISIKCSWRPIKILVLMTLRSNFLLDQRKEWAVMKYGTSLKKPWRKHSRRQGLEYEIQPGEGAFYGPKIEYVLRDSLNRLWQCGTIQLDFNLPVRLNAEYVDENSNKKHPVMLHRAIVGSMERFIGILIEHYAGKFPTWLAPAQAVVMNISDSQAKYVGDVVDFLKKNDIRCESDLRNEKITYKIREHSISRIPYLLVIGDREMENRQVAVRTQQGEDLGVMTLEEFVEIMNTQITAKS